jgi:hypothetical protein
MGGHGDDNNYDSINQEKDWHNKQLAWKNMSLASFEQCHESLVQGMSGVQWKGLDLEKFKASQAHIAGTLCRW